MDYFNGVKSSWKRELNSGRAMPSEVRYKPDPGKRKCQAVQEDVSKRGDSRTCPEEQVRVNFVKEEDS